MIIAGYGPGISRSVARSIGKNHVLALLSRNKSKLESAVHELAKEDIDAHAYPTDIRDTSAVLQSIRDIQKKLGPV